MALFIQSASDYRHFRRVNLDNVKIARQVEAPGAAHHYRHRLVQIRSEYYRGVAL